MYLPAKVIFQITLCCAHSTFLFQCSYISSAFGFLCRQGNLVIEKLQSQQDRSTWSWSVKRLRLQPFNYQNTVNPSPHLTPTSSLSYCSSVLSWITLAIFRLTGLSSLCYSFRYGKMNIDYVVCFDALLPTFSFTDLTAELLCCFLLCNLALQ